MADCAETLRELETFLDDELSSDAVAHIRTHLDGCVDCQQAYEFHAELRQVVQAKCRSDEMPPGLIDRIRSCFGDGLVDPGEGNRR